MKKMAIRWKLLGVVASSVVLAGALSYTLASCGKKDGEKPKDYIPNDVADTSIKDTEDGLYSGLIKKYENIDGKTHEEAKDLALGVIKSLQEEIKQHDDKINDYINSKEFYKDLDKSQQKEFINSLEQSKLGFVKNEEKKLGFDVFDANLLAYEVKQLEKQTFDDKNFKDKDSQQKWAKVEQVIENFDANHPDTSYTQIGGIEELINDIKNQVSFSEEEIANGLECNLILSWLSENISDSFFMQDVNTLQKLDLLRNTIFSNSPNGIIDKQYFGELFQYNYPTYYVESHDGALSQDKNIDNSSYGHGSDKFNQQDVDAATEVDLSTAAAQNANLFDRQDFTSHAEWSDESHYAVRHLGEFLPGFFISFKVTSVPKYTATGISFKYNFGVSKFIGSNAIDYYDPTKFTNTYWFDQNGSDVIAQNNTYEFTANIFNPSLPINEIYQPNQLAVLRRIAANNLLFNEGDAWAQNTNIQLTYRENKQYVTDNLNGPVYDNTYDGTTEGYSLVYANKENKRPTWTQIDPRIWNVIDEALPEDNTVLTWRNNIRTELNNTPIYIDAKDPMLNGVPKPDIYCNPSFASYRDLLEDYTSESSASTDGDANYAYSMFGGLKLMARVVDVTPPLSMLGGVEPSFDNQAVKIEWCVMKDNMLVLTPDNWGIDGLDKGGLYPFHFLYNGSDFSASTNVFKGLWVTYHFDADEFDQNRSSAYEFSSAILGANIFNTNFGSNKDATEQQLSRFIAKNIAGGVCFGLEVVCAAAALAASIINFAAYAATLGFGIPLLINAGLCLLQLGVSTFALTVRGIKLVNDDKDVANLSALLDNTPTFGFVNDFLSTNSLEQTQTDNKALLTSANYAVVETLNTKYNDYVHNHYSEIKSSIDNVANHLKDVDFTSEVKSNIDDWISKLQAFENSNNVPWIISNSPNIAAFSSLAILGTTLLTYFGTGFQIAATAGVAVGAGLSSSVLAGTTGTLSGMWAAADKAWFAYLAGGYTDELFDAWEAAVDAADTAITDAATNSAEAAATKGAESAEQGAAPATQHAVPIAVIVVILAITVIVGILDAILDALL